MIKVIKQVKDSKEEPSIIDNISEKLNEIGFEVINKGQDYQKDAHFRIKSKEDGKTDTNIAQSRDNIKKVLEEISSKYNVKAKFSVMLKSTGYIEGSIELKENINDSYEYFGTEKLKQIAKSGEAELLKSNGKKEYNDEYYIVINNKKEKLDAGSDKDAIKKFKEIFKKKILATDSVNNNETLINLLTDLNTKLFEVADAAKKVKDAVATITPTTEVEKRLYVDVDFVGDNTSNAAYLKIMHVRHLIGQLKFAHIEEENRLLDFAYNYKERLINGEKFENLMKELEEIWNNIDYKVKYEDLYKSIKRSIIATNNNIARRKVKAADSNSKDLINFNKVYKLLSKLERENIIKIDEVNDTYIKYTWINDEEHYNPQTFICCTNGKIYSGVEGEWDGDINNADEICVDETFDDFKYGMLEIID